MATNYADIHEIADEQVIKKSLRDTTAKRLMGTHRDKQRQEDIPGGYHKTNSEYQQNYPDEYSYTPNRRYCRDLFERVFVAAVFL